MIVKLDGKDYDLSDAAAFAAYQTAVTAKAEAEATARADKAIADERARADAADASRDNAIAELAPLKAEKAAAARRDLETRAHKVLSPDVAFDGMSDRQVMERALKSRNIDCTGKPDVYVAGRFDGIVDGEVTTQADPALLAGFNALQPTMRNGVAVAPATNANPLANRWKEPLTSSKQERK